MFTDKNGDNWFKGNLHTHTKRSDGKLEPDEVISLYASRGYDFLALTDHWKRSPDNESDKLLTISGVELDRSVDVRDGVFHIVGIGMTRDPECERGDGAQQLIDAIRAAGGAAILAHPAWSLDTPESIMKLSGLCATEIYNSVSGTPFNGRPYSGLISDMLSSAGYRLNLVASDDAHFYDPSVDACRSFIMLRAKSNTRENIMSALAAGDYYATQGPLFSHTIEDGILTVTTTPASQVLFLSDSVWVDDRTTRGDGITCATYKIKEGRDTFVRYEITDANGLTGWSQPIFLA